MMIVRLATLHEASCRGESCRGAPCGRPACAGRHPATMKCHSERSEESCSASAEPPPKGQGEIPRFARNDSHFQSSAGSPLLCLPTRTSPLGVRAIGVPTPMRLSSLKTKGKKPLPLAKIHRLGGGFGPMVDVGQSHSPASLAAGSPLTSHLPSCISLRNSLSSLNAAKWDNLWLKAREYWSGPST